MSTVRNYDDHNNNLMVKCFIAHKYYFGRGAVRGDQSPVTSDQTRYRDEVNIPFGKGYLSLLLSPLKIEMLVPACPQTSPLNFECDVLVGSFKMKVLLGAC